jgi:hypothetical protein
VFKDQMITKRHKIFGVAFMLAVTILLVDRLFVLPRGADAAHTASETPAVSVPVQVTTTDLVTTTKTHAVAERLERLCPQERLQQTPLPDAFSLPSVWLADVDPNGSLSGRVNHTDAFRQRYELLAVAESNGETIAFVNHYRMKVGQVLAGFTLAAIDDRSATFEAEGVRVVLRLKESR